ncbi:helix-turn-helix domain-containing protein [Myxococcus stipitatus]|uniref:helix-turn-helix domain-containing protein n=1 Tax=Myxococcus stipitatus TaxID=83455 RepID=UPI003CC8E03E
MTPLLLSKRQAAKMLGVSRGRTLDELINAGFLRPVLILGRMKLPREEIERLAREGTEPMPSPNNTPRSRSSRRPQPTNVGAAIRAIRLD